MRHWLPKSIALGLVSLLCAFAFGVDYERLSKSLENATREEAISLLNREDLSRDQELRQVLAQLSADGGQDALQRARQLVDLRVLQANVSPDRKAASISRDIKSSPLYRDPGVQESANWLGNALQRLRNIQLPEWRMNSRGPSGDFRGIGSWLIVLMWALLGIGLAVLLFFVMKHVRWKRNLARKSKALLDEDEPERSADEWLELADRLNRDGKHREAVRCLYLACLLKFDEHLVARFDRGQTNWEHLGRIQSSPKRPPDLDFLPPTQAFDLIWYGRRVQGEADVERFRAWYREITGALHGVRA